MRKALSDNLHFAYTHLNDETIKIYDCSDNKKVITVPSEIDGYKVLSIDTGTFSQCANVEHIIISNGIECIHDFAFEDCISLKQLDLPESIQSIGDYVLDACNALECINIDPDNSTFSSLNGVLFDKKQEVLHCYPANKQEKTYIAPDTLKFINGAAFWYNNILEHIYLPNQLEAIGSEAFRGCNSLIDIVIPNSVKAIGYSAFQDCTELQKVKLSNSLSEIPSSIFENCKSLKSINIPDSVRFIKDLAFYKCTNLISISIPDSVIKVANDAFCDCPSKFKIKCHQNSWISQWAKKHFYETVPYSSKLNDFLTRDTETFETNIE